MAVTRVRQTGLNLGQVITAATSTQNDFAFGDAATIYANNASQLTITGLAAGIDGQIVEIVSIGAGTVVLNHQDTGSAANNRFINYATSQPTFLAAGVGRAVFRYDATALRWRMIDHDQGASIAYVPTVTGSGAMTISNQGSWNTAQFYLRGRQLTLWLYQNSPIVLAGTANTQVSLSIVGYVAANTELGLFLLNNTAGNFQGWGQVTAGGSVLTLIRNDSGNFTLGNFSVFGQFTMMVN